MKKVLSAPDLQSLDAYTIAHEPIASIALMERAAEAIVRALTAWYGLRHDFCIFAGAGNNGGDALAVARLLAEQGYRVAAYLFNPKEQLSEDCAANRDRLLTQEAAPVDFVEVTQQFVPPTFTPDTIIIDGLFGVGLNRVLDGGFAALVQFLNASHRPIVALDLPSGLSADGHTVAAGAPIVQATRTLMLGQPKLVCYLPDAAAYLGEVEVLDIGLHPLGLSALKPMAHVLTTDDVCRLLRPRDRYAHKGSFGHAFLMAGSAGMAGAAMLSAEAALRSGLGKLSVLTPACNMLPLQVRVPEAVLLSLDSLQQGAADSPLSGKSAVGIGPGIGQSVETTAAVEALLKACRQQPLVIDADGINLLSTFPDWLHHLPPHTILTPHPAEFDRLVGQRCANAHERFLKAQEMANHYNLYVILKGHHTQIFAPDGEVYINTTGNAGMATAGSGDVLTGLLVGLCAQGYTPHHAALLGVWLHGLAGDMAAARMGQHGMLASDLLAHLPQAFVTLQHS